MRARADALVRGMGSASSTLAPTASTWPLPDWAPPEAGQILPLTNDDPSLRGRIVYSDAFDGLE